MIVYTNATAVDKQVRLRFEDGSVKTFVVTSGDSVRAEQSAELLSTRTKK